MGEHQEREKVWGTRKVAKIWSNLSFNL